jgi:protein-S-isoprenylcysteine O-methyltransferase Ste14
VIPALVTALLWSGWVLSWMLAAFWRKPAVARPSVGATAAYLIPTAIGGLMFGYGARMRYGHHADDAWLLWATPDALCWCSVALVAAGFAFTWWARVTLGDLWSSDVTRKEGHVLVERGPYRLVRHPIYTGLILAVLATAAEVGTAATIVGASLMIFGFWLKARLEERFLGPTLGEAVYDDYRRRTPMLIPFWPTRR